MKHSPLKRKTPLRRKKGLRKVSVKHQDRMAVYYAIRKIYMEQNPVCMICQSAPSTDVHHRKSRRGDLLWDVNWFMSLCRNCHSVKVHGDVENAKKMGWLVPFWK